MNRVAFQIRKPLSSKHLALNINPEPGGFGTAKSDLCVSSCLSLSSFRLFERTLFGGSKL